MFGSWLDENVNGICDVFLWLINKCFTHVPTEQMGFLMSGCCWFRVLLPVYPHNTSRRRKLMRQVTRCRNGLAGNKAWRRGWGKQNDTWIPTPVTQHTGAPGSTSWWMPEKWIFWRPNRLMVKLISLYVYLWKKIRLPVSVWVSLAWSEWKIEKQTG